jgi:hypothetical protein
MGASCAYGRSLSEARSRIREARNRAGWRRGARLLHRIGLLGELAELGATGAVHTVPPPAGSHHRQCHRWAPRLPPTGPAPAPLSWPDAAVRFLAEAGDQPGTGLKARVSAFERQRG